MAQLKEREVLMIAKVPIETIRGIGKKQILISHRNQAAEIYSLSHDETPSKIQKKYRPSKSLVSDAVYAEEGSKIITVSRNTLSIFDKETKDCVEFKGHSRDISCVTINKSNTKIVTGSQDGTFIVWNTQGQQIEKFSCNEGGHQGWINSVGFIPGSDELIATASEDGSVKIWDLESNTLLKTFVDGQLIDLEKLAENKQTSPIGNTDFAVKSLCFSNDGSLMAYGGRNGKVYIINLAVNETLQSLEVPGRITALASGENQPLIAVAIPNKILLWNIIEEKIVAEYGFNYKNEVYCYSMTFVEDELIIGLTTGQIIRLDIIKN
ncbi:guanine nucleotide-binding protein beta subunit-like protein [Enterocytozoon bieneusi H348]|nr:guanine nucleotide-binding protein beta subunit-like protein [Enterocytozoon bieneusi H348]|eukprot:XP_001827772.1 guanine nucleotide-binding protein beta subunit-like protein [Enterocytozoon bieneusi H348]